MRKKHLTFAQSLPKFNSLAVKHLLLDRQETVSQLARDLKITPGYMHELLKGNRNTNGYIAQVAKHLGVSQESITLKEGGIGCDE